MIEASLSFNMDVPKLKKKFEDASKKAQSEVLKQMVKDTEDYIPYKTGKLNSSVNVDESNATINYTAPYAAFAFNPLYKGKEKVYNRTVHSKAQGNPYQASNIENGQKWALLYAKKLAEEINNGNN
jgi:hypothetical protein